MGIYNHNLRLLMKRIAKTVLKGATEAKAQKAVKLPEKRSRK